MEAVNQLGNDIILRTTLATLFLCQKKRNTNAPDRSLRNAGILEKELQDIDLGLPFQENIYSKNTHAPEFDHFFIHITGITGPFLYGNSFIKFHAFKKIYQNR